MIPDKVNLKEKLGKFNDLWSPKIIGQLNDYHLKLGKIRGEFTWHDHKETDELFMVIEGKMTLEFRDTKRHLLAGELCVVPAGVEHRPVALEECSIMMIEPAGTLNTGEAGGEYTVEKPEWI